MPIPHRRTILWFLAAAGLLLLTGCVSPNAQQTRFYRLNPEGGSGLTSETGGQAVLQPELGVGPVNIAGYLDRPQLINRIDPYRLQLRDFDYWAGTLQDNVLSGLVDALQGCLGRDQVIAYPWHRAVQPKRELILDISRFDEEVGRFVVKLRWVLLAERGDKLLAAHQWVIVEPVEGTTPEAQVAAASRALSRLAERLVVEINAF